MAIGALVPLGLSLLTKLPEIWGAVAGLFGAKTPSTVVEAGKMANEISSAVMGNKVPPETMLKLEEIFSAERTRMAELVFEERKLDMQGILGAQDVEKASYQSADEYVRRTRPKVLRVVTYTMVGYVFFCIIVLIYMSYSPKFESGEIKMVMDVMKEFFIYLGGVFSIAFTGYNITRMKEKKAGCEDVSGVSNGGVLGGFLPFLKK